VRTLSSDEIRAVWAALEAEDSLGDALRLGFYTGARISEVLGLPFSEIDLYAQLWTIAAERWNEIRGARSQRETPLKRHRAAQARVN
jgi:integrase